jgi:hypothetical protein
MPKRVTAHVPKAPVSSTAKTPAGRPAPVRIDWELDAPWRAIRMVEGDRSSNRGVGTLKEAKIPGWADNFVNTDFRDNVSPNLKKFLTLGKSSLTPYEATQLAFGLGLGGTGHVEPIEKAKGYTRGDRVELKVTAPDGKTSTTQGIVVPGGVLTVEASNQYKFYAPEYDNGTQGRAKVVISKVVAGALNDGALEAKFG